LQPGQCARETGGRRFGQADQASRQTGSLRSLQARLAARGWGGDRGVVDWRRLWGLAALRFGNGGRAPFDRAGRCRVWHAGEQGGALLQRGLPPNDLLKLLLELVLV